MRLICLLVAASALSACLPSHRSPEAFTATIDPVTTTGVSGIEVSRGIGPPDADPDRCYGREITPAVIETVVENRQLQRRIVEDRTETWFETPCELDDDAEFTATLQRALAARGLYGGEITGTLDPATAAAIRAYQAPQGLDSSVLSLAAARQLGLVIWDPELAADPAT
ncbi:peptidoglycan-binding domain-containing protein [Gymnodinialimonas sp. 2305UL16-5]|uniref:peptidoglycan-binding domain-containing protein n=1 Tax=Gymnodinialimonas mytili TaxID=3126503 RepID=UPI0030A9DF67